MLSLRSVLYISTSSLFDWVSVVMKWILMPQLARCLHNLYLFMCGSRGGVAGPDPPPGKVQKYMVSLKLFLAILARTPLKSQSYQSSIQCWVLIGPPAKRHLNGVSLAGHWLPVNSGIWILPPLIKLKTKQKKTRQSWTPSDSTSWVPACLFSCPMMGIIISFFIHQYGVCNSKNSCTYQPSNQAIKVAIKIQGCEQGVIEEEEDI